MVIESKQYRLEGHLRRHVQELIKINTTVGVFAEGSLLPQLSGISVTHVGYFFSGKEYRALVTISRGPFTIRRLDITENKRDL